MSCLCNGALLIICSQVSVAGPAGSIVSNARDMSKWLQFHLRKGQTPSGERLVSYDSLAETYKPQMASPSPMNSRDLTKPDFPVSDVHMSYDMGWMTNLYRGKCFQCRTVVVWGAHVAAWGAHVAAWGAQDVIRRVIYVLVGVNL